MLCKNCGYILSGKENFCPNCASPLKNEKNRDTEKTDEEKTSLHQEDEIIKQEYIFPREEELKPKRQLQIFSESDEEKETEKTKQKSYGGRIMLMIFLICAFSAATFAVIDYFDLTSAVFSFTKAESHEDAETVFDHKSSVIKPDKSLVPSYAYVMSGEGIMLRKGPGKAYAPIAELKEQATVQILGESLSEKGWVYVCFSENEIYGWADAAFITDSVFDITQKNTAATEAATVAEDYIR